jgi:hypothetical protein
LNIVRGKPKLEFGEAGMNKHDPAIVGGKHDAGGPASVVGVRAKLPTPGITKPFVEAGQAMEAAPCSIATVVESL